jgi:uncharacterized protein (TIGR03437 family)
MRVAMILAVCALSPLPGRCGVLVLADQVAAVGQTLTAAVTFSAEGEAISGIQFDIESDAAISLRVLPGERIGASAKVLYAATLPNQVLRVLIIGMNRELIRDGELLRTVISVDPNVSPGLAQIRISKASSSDPDGNPISLRSAAAAVQIQAGSAVQPFALSRIVNAASLLPGPVSPGEIITILGGADLAGVSTVLFNGVRAPILYTGPTQVNTIVPFNLDPNATVNLEIRTPERSFATGSVSLVTAAPAIFTQDASGAGPGAILNEDYTINSYLNPASADSVIVLYGTGFGPLTPPALDGQTATGPASTLMPVTATIAGVPAVVTYAGAAPGCIAGVVQINVQVPKNVLSNPVAPISLTVGSMTTPAGATVSIK